MDSKYGTDKSIPQLILVGASCDDIFVIVLFSTFLGMAQGGHANLMDFINIPVSIVLGIALGATTGYLLSLFFETAYAHNHCVRNSIKSNRCFGRCSFLLMAVETMVGGEYICLRSVGRSKHGLRSQNQKCYLCIKTIV